MHGLGHINCYEDCTHKMYAMIGGLGWLLLGVLLGIYCEFLEDVLDLEWFFVIVVSGGRVEGDRRGGGGDHDYCVI